MLQNFRVLIFHVKYFHGQGYPWNDAKKTWSIRTVCCVRGYYAAVGELLVCEKNTVGTYCGSKDRQFIGH